MQVNYNGSSYRIRWRYKYPKTKTGLRKRNRPASETTCILETLNGHLIHESTIKRHSADAPLSKDALRKTALRKLLLESCPNPHNREFRTQVWKDYLERPRPKGTPKMEKVAAATA